MFDDESRISRSQHERPSKRIEKGEREFGVDGHWRNRRKCVDKSLSGDEKDRVMWHGEERWGKL
jgi:hypothetical protein